MEEEIDELFIRRKDNSAFLLTYLNQHGFNIFCENEEYRDWILNKFYVLQDGIGIFMFMRFMNKDCVRSVATDIYDKIFSKILNCNRYKIAIIGGSEKLHKTIINHTGIQNIVYHLEGNLSEDFFDKVDTILRKYNPNLVIVGMGIPLQEKVALHISQAKDSCSVICVGNFLEFYFGIKKRAPILIRNLGLEWLFRLLVEPKRLWKRYLIGIPKFIFRAVKISLNKERICLKS